MALVARYPKCPYLFQYRGKRLRNVRSGFEKACKEASYEGVIFHDTWRSAVRRMEDAGIPRWEAMQITGHMTETVHNRNDIGSEAGATEGGRKLRETRIETQILSKVLSQQRRRESPGRSGY